MILFIGSRKRGGESRPVEMFNLSDSVKTRSDFLPIRLETDFLCGKKQLAFSLLMEAGDVSQYEAEQLTPAFTAEVVAKFDFHGWTITDEQIKAWVASKNLNDNRKGV